MYKDIFAIHLGNKPQGAILRVLVPSGLDDVDLNRLMINGIIKGELRIDDGRTITSDQRKKIYATIADIAAYTGYLPEELKEHMKYRYVAKSGVDYFSLSDCSVTTARLFINYLIDFAMEWDIPLMDMVLNRTDDISAALYSALMHKRCIICGQAGNLHHVDRVGMGRNRARINHFGMNVMSLCPIHHNECHRTGQPAFDDKYHVYGIKADEKICEVWILNGKEPP